MKKLKGIDGKLDEAWSELVKLEAGYKCEVCEYYIKGLERYLSDVKESLSRCNDEKESEEILKDIYETEEDLSKLKRIKPLNSHHIYSRSKRSVRWDESNGVCLCVSHHTFNSKFSAHKTPTEFTYWLHEVYGDEYMDELKRKAHKTVKWFKHEKEELLEQLLEKINKYKPKQR